MATNPPKLKKITKKEDLKSDEAVEGYLIDADEKTARSMIDSIKKKDKNKIISLQGRDDAFNRRAIETLKINYLVSPEISPKKDTLKQRDSGINHVVAKEAARKNISFVIDFSFIKNLEAKEQAKVLARIIQNIKICRKAKCAIKLFSGDGDEKGVDSFLVSLGMSSQEVRAARSF